MLRAGLVSAAFALWLLLFPQVPVKAQLPGQAQHAAASAVPIATPQFPFPENLYYSVQWRLWYAGSARLTLRSERDQEWQSALHLESAGLVSKLYTVNDDYLADLATSHLCAEDTRLDAREGKRHKLTTVRFDYSRHKATYDERDLLKNAVVKTAQTDIPGCPTDIVGALMRLRTLHLEPGQSAQIPVSNGQKSVNVKVDAQQRELVETKLGKFKTIRCEANIFNGVLYSKDARLFIWLTDDARHLPVQIRVRMQFVIGTITLTLDKEDQNAGGVSRAAMAVGRP